MAWDPSGPPMPDAWIWSAVRSRRNRLLSLTDWTQLPDSPVDVTAWAAYRTALRNLPGTTTDPRDVAWPTPPGPVIE